ncbi:MAG: HpcH/HpaI aldolase/citrate lyase family protein [Granulosicoccus sp.]
MARKKRSSSAKNNAKSTMTAPRTGFPASGCWVNIFDPIVGELVGRCGYDYAMIDMEHSPADMQQTLAMIRAVQFGGAKALVRVPDKQPQWIGRLMDMGADGVMVPMVNSAEEAQTLAAAAVYAPDGTRGMAAPIVRASGYGVNTDHYLENYRSQFTLLLQIESAQAVDAAAEIAAVDGVDCVFIGPFDLSGSLGHRAEPDHKVTRAAISKVCKATKTAGKLLSTLNTPKFAAKRLFKDGYDLVFSGMDVSMLREAMVKDAANSESLIEEAL